MTLTVPTAGTSAGRSANVRFEPDGTGDAIAQFGHQLADMGRRLEDDYLDREAARFQTDLTGDMNALRLEVATIGDPDEAERTWQARTGELRQAYESGQREDGSPRVSERNRERFGLVFDNLYNRNAFSLGRQTLAARQAQREATYLSYVHTATQVASNGDPDMRATLVAQGDEQIAGLVRAGVIDAAEAERRRQGLRGDIANARAIQALSEDPVGFLSGLKTGEFEALPAEAQARYKVRAQSAIDQMEKSARDAAEKAEQERAKAISDRLVEIRKIAETGRQAVDEQFLNSDEVAASDEFARTMAALSLRDEGKLIGQLPPVALQQLIVQERNRSVTHEWQTERLQILESALEQHQTGYSKDPVAYAQSQGRDVPELADFDPQDPSAFRDDMMARIAWAESDRVAGFTDKLRYLSNDERARLKEMSSVDADPSDRASLARELTVALSGANPAVVQSYELDPVFSHVGELMVQGGASERLAQEVFKGQQALAAKNVVLPPAADRLDAGYETLETVFARVPGGQQVQGQVRQATDALYAARMQQQGPTDDIDEDVYRQALHEVMGGVGDYDRSDALGGVQELRGSPTIMPPGIGASRVDDALDRLGLKAVNVKSSRRVVQSHKFDEATFDAQLRAIGGGALPAVGGKRLSPADLSEMQLQSVGNDRFIFVFDTATGLRQVMDEDGEPYLFSLRQLIQVVEQ